MKNIIWALPFALSAMLLNINCSKEASNPCAVINCLNGGTCYDGSCACGPCFEGANCGQETRAKYLGNYAGTLTIETAGGTNYYSPTISFVASSQGSCYITGNVIIDAPVTAQLSSSIPGRFEIGQQPLSNSINTTYGYIKFNGNQVYVEFGGYTNGSAYILKFTGFR